MQTMERSDVDYLSLVGSLKICLYFYQTLKAKAKVKSKGNIKSKEKSKGNFFVIAFSTCFLNLTKGKESTLIFIFI